MIGGVCAAVVSRKPDWWSGSHSRNPSGWIKDWTDPTKMSLHVKPCVLCF